LNLNYHNKMEVKLIGRGGPGRGQGRKPLVPGEPLHPVSIKMTTPQRAKLKRLGGSKWVRDRIDKAREKE
jgi:hypothetical protein